MASVEAERSGDRPLPTRTAATPAHEKPLTEDNAADPYEALVERLFSILEENQVAIATLAQAWRHTRRALELTQADLAYTKRALAAEQLIRRRLTAGEAPLPARP